MIGWDNMIDASYKKTGRVARCITQWRMKSHTFHTDTIPAIVAEMVGERPLFTKMLFAVVMSNIKENRDFNP